MGLLIGVMAWRGGDRRGGSVEVEIGEVGLGGFQWGLGRIPILMGFCFFTINFCFLDSDGWILDSDWLDFGFQWGLDWIWLGWFGLA